VHRALEEMFADDDKVVFFHIQTVWEGHETNTPQNGPKVAKQNGIEVPVGYDARVDGGRISLAMIQYGTGGTPWTVVIDKKGVVRYSDLTPGRAEDLERIIKKAKKGR
jgi:hypothetical protein